MCYGRVNNNAAEHESSLLTAHARDARARFVRVLTLPSANIINAQGLRRNIRAIVTGVR